MNRERRLFLDYGGLIVNYDFNKDTLARAHALVLSRLNSNGQRFDFGQVSQAHDKAIRAYLDARKRDNSEWSMNKIIGLMLSNLGADVSVTDISEIYKFNDHNSEPMPKAILALERLSRHARLGIISNLPHDSLFYELEAYGIRDLFDPVVVSYEVGFRKPHPAIYQEALRRANAKAKDSIFVSHDAEEVKGAENVGMKGILVKSLEEVIGKL
jgi:putative hydrolase of the HAD superfamily